MAITRHHHVKALHDALKHHAAHQDALIRAAAAAIPPMVDTVLAPVIPADSHG